MGDRTRMGRMAGIASRVNREWLASILDLFARPYIDGVEVTQTIQYYKADQHLSDLANRGPDNSIRLIASKAAWVRVYVRSGLVVASTPTTGTLSLERRRAGRFWEGAGAPIAPQPPGSIAAKSDVAYAEERGNISSSLNFVIPAAAFYGDLRLTIRLTSRTGAEYDSQVVLVDATLRQTLRLRGIFVSYNGPSTANVRAGAPPPPTLTLAAPALSDLQSTAGQALRAMPVQSTGSFASAGTIAWTSPIDDPRSAAGACSTNWGKLLTALGNQRTADGNRGDVVYYGLLPAGIPIGVPGCGVGGLGAGVSGDQGTLMHEIGHGYGFQHTPCGAAGATDANYPTYRPYPSASIGEYGLDISNGNVFRPASTFDYMSYCFPQWMSLYQHSRLILHSRLGREWLRDEPWWKDYLRWRPYVVWRDLPNPPDPWRVLEVIPDPVVAITGIVHDPGTVEVLTVARVAAAGTPPGAATQLTARLTDAQGSTLARAPIHRLDPHGNCGCHGANDPSPTYTFQAYIPDVEPGAALTIEEDGKELWSRKAPDRAPHVGRAQVELGRDAGLHLRWESDAAIERPEAWLQWSPDEGNTWRGLATGVYDGEATLPLTGLPAGPVLIRVLVHDGFLTATSDPTRVELPERPAEAAILHPGEGQTLIAGATLHLWAAVSDPAGQPIDSADALWLLDGEQVARDLEAWLEAPSAGEHEVTLVVRTSGCEARSAVTFRCVGRAEPASPGEDE